ncbi:MAG TPA: FkbM family methyltransferase [Chloroflexota bacterium]|jgi:FkbM family methyltransferase|nr:FkbM family methyltransferase [Chloroflexota bacterium]
MKRPRILVFSDAFAPVLGGMTTVPTLLADGLTGAGHETTVVTPVAAADIDDSQYRFRVVRQPGLGQLAREIARADVVHLSGFDLLTFLLAKLLRRPTVWSHYDYAPTPCSWPGEQEAVGRCGPLHLGPACPLRQRLRPATPWQRVTSYARQMVRLACLNAVAANVIALPGHTASFGERDLRVVPLGIHPIDGEQVREDVPVIAFLSRHTKGKGGDVLLRAVSQLPKNSVRLVMASTGPERAAWQELARQLGVDASFPGLLDEPNKAQLLLRADVTVVPTVYPEYFGLVAIEAMSAGSFVIGSATGGLGELLRICGGAIVPPGDHIALAAALQSQLADPAAIRRAANDQRQLVRSHYSQATMVRQYIDVYESVTDQPSRSSRRRGHRMMNRDDLRRLARRAISLYHVAQGPIERLSVSRYVCSYLIARLRPGNAEAAATSVRLRGTRFMLGLGGAESAPFSEIYLDRVYDRLDDFVPKAGWTVFDLGANAGVFATLQARRGARVYAFEPNPITFSRLAQTAAHNGYINLRPFNYAVARRSGMAWLVTAESSVTGSISSVDDGHGHEVQVVRLDDVVPQLAVDHVDLLKIDTEGAEFDILSGATDTLRKVDRIIMEWHSPLLLEQTSQLLEEQGFVEAHREEMFGEDVGIIYFQRASRELALAV